MHLDFDLGTAIALECNHPNEESERRTICIAAFNDLG
jgi:hypothetical protein